MIQVALKGKTIPFFYGISVTNEISDYKKAKPKVDLLKEFLKWKHSLKSEGIDCSDITFEDWKSQHEEEDDTIKDTMMVYYLCYSAGCRIDKKKVMTYEEFINLIDEDYNNNLQRLAEALKESSGQLQDTSEKN